MLDCGTISPGLYSCATAALHRKVIDDLGTEFNQATFRRQPASEAPDYARPLHDFDRYGYHYLSDSRKRRHQLVQIGSAICFCRISRVVSGTAPLLDRQGRECAVLVTMGGPVSQLSAPDDVSRRYFSL